MDFVGSLPESKNGNKFILHILCYFTRFSTIFLSKTANASDVIVTLVKLFTIYIILKAFYLNRK